MREVEDLRGRLRRYSVAIIRHYGELPNRSDARMIGGQFFRSGTSPGAHHREAHRARSDAEFVSKMEGGLQELDETAYWLELLVEGQIHDSPQLRALTAETDELIRIFV